MLSKLCGGVCFKLIEMQPETDTCFTIIMLLNPSFKRVFPIVCEISCSLFKSFGDATKCFQLEGAFTCIIIGLLLHYLLIHRIKKNICIYSEVPFSELASAVHESILSIQLSESGSSVLSQKVNNARISN